MLNDTLCKLDAKLRTDLIATIVWEGNKRSQEGTLQAASPRSTHMRTQNNNCQPADAMITLPRCAVQVVELPGKVNRLLFLESFAALPAKFWAEELHCLHLSPTQATHRITSLTAFSAARL